MTRRRILADLGVGGKSMYIVIYDNVFLVSPAEVQFVDYTLKCLKRDNKRVVKHRGIR